MVFLILWNSFIHVISPILSTYFFSLNIRLGLHLSRILTEHSTSVVNLSSSSLLSDNGKLEIAINLWAELFYVTLKSTERISVFVHLMEWRTNSGISDDEFICGGIFAAHSIPWGSLTQDSSEMTPWKIHRTHLRFFFYILKQYWNIRLHCTCMNIKVKLYLGTKWWDVSFIIFPFARGLDGFGHF